VFIQFFVVGSERRTCFETQCIRSSKVVDFGTNRKRVGLSDFVVNSNLGPILLRFRNIAGFLLRRATPPLFHPNFGGVPLGLDCRCCGPEERRSYKLIIHLNSFELTQSIHRRYINVTDGRTDRRTDGWMTYDCNIALCTTCIER